MTIHSFTLELVRTALRSELETRARRCTSAILRWGAAWTTLLMVLPGLLSSHPVANGLTGAAVGYAATLLVAAATYLWLLYVAPYRRLRSLVSPGLTNAQ